MFASISKRYDFLNRLLSLNRDKYWRRTAVSHLEPNGTRFLDVCTGTGDVAIEITKQRPSAKVVASDFCAEMLHLGVKKCAKHRIHSVEFVCADTEHLPFKDAIFDGAIVSFGIRNVVDRIKALEEMTRTVRDGGQILILEFSTPTNKLFRAVYHYYFKKVLPRIGALISKHDSAYSYLPDSVLAFPTREEFAALMQSAGMGHVEFKDLTFGIVTLYIGTKGQKK